jgi:hypothetical protein
MRGREGGREGGRERMGGSQCDKIRLGGRGGVEEEEEETMANEQ